MKVGSIERSTERSRSGALLAGGLAAILASTCCLGPLILVTLGLSGAWIGNLTKLEPYRLYFIAFAVAALFLAGRSIFRPAPVANPAKYARCRTAEEFTKSCSG